MMSGFRPVKPKVLPILRNPAPFKRALPPLSRETSPGQYPRGTHPVFSFISWWKKASLCYKGLNHFLNKNRNDKRTMIHDTKP